MTIFPCARRFALIGVLAAALVTGGCTAMLLGGNPAHADSQSQGGAAPTQSDSAISVQLRNALAASDSVDATDVEVEVNRGVVVLSGRVPSEDDAEQAEQIANAVRGVQMVRNRLSVSDHGPGFN